MYFVSGNSWDCFEIVDEDQLVAAAKNAADDVEKPITEVYIYEVDLESAKRTVKITIE